MGGWQLHTCILFYSFVCSHGGSAPSTSPQPDEVLSIVAFVVVRRPWSIPRRMEMATLVLCGDTGPKQMLDMLHVKCADEVHPV